MLIEDFSCRDNWKIRVGTSFPWEVIDTEANTSLLSQDPDLSKMENEVFSYFTRLSKWDKLEEKIKKDKSGWLLLNDSKRDFPYNATNIDIYATNIDIYATNIDIFFQSSGLGDKNFKKYSEVANILVYHSIDHIRENISPLLGQKPIHFNGKDFYVISTPKILKKYGFRGDLSKEIVIGFSLPERVYLMQEIKTERSIKGKEDDSYDSEIFNSKYNGIFRKEWPIEYIPPSKIDDFYQSGLPTNKS